MQSVVLADTREGMVRVGADVPSLAIAERRNWLLPLGCAAAQGYRQLPRSSCCAVTPTDMLAVEVASIQNVVRGNVGIRGVTRLEASGARSKFGAPMFEPEVFRKQMYCIEESTKKYVTFLGLFDTPQ